VNGQPHIVFVVEHGPDPSFLASLEDIVPGTLVYGRLSSGARRHRLHKAIELGTADGFTTGSFGVYDVVVPVHGAWLVEAQLTTSDASYQRRDEASAQLATLFWQDTEEFREAALRRGKSATKSAVAGGTLRPHVLDIATPYQFAGVAWSCARPWVMSVWACGSGKTLGAIMAATAYGGPVLVVAPAKARHVWWSQVQEYTTLKPFRIRPKSDMRKNEQTLSEYLLECESTKQYPFVIVGAESLSDNLEAIRTVEPEVLILDELHTHGSKKRWRAIPQADGSVSFERRKTAASERVGSKVDRENRAVAAMEVSRLPSLQLRIGLTATPLDDGRTRRLWSQLDLLAPGGFSHSYSRFAKRYCDARPGEYGGLDDKGSSNMDELKSRCSWIMHEVPYSESHAALPDTRVQVVYLSSTELNRAERWNDNKTFGQAIKSLTKEARAEADEDARMRVVEARLAQACSRKRKYVVGEVLEGLKGGGKVVVFTSRRRETELWAHEIRRAATRGDEAQGTVPIWMAHGGVSESERDDMIDAFRESTGPCCLVATGQSVGTGVDGLQTADLAVFAMLPWKPGDFVQWKGRFDRLGGSATLLKVVVASGTYDERVVEILVDKFGPIKDFLQADELAGLDGKLLGTDDKVGLLDSIVSKLGAA
jgi:hypothetical protein